MVYAKGRNCCYLYFPMPREGVVVIYISLCQGKELRLSTFPSVNGRSYAYLYSPVPREGVVVIYISLWEGKELWSMPREGVMVISISLRQGKELWLSLFPCAKGRSCGYLYSPVPREGVVIIYVSMLPTDGYSGDENFSTPNRT